MLTSKAIVAIRITALVLIVAGAANLYNVGFDELRALRGALHGNGIDISMWVGVSGMLLGGLLLVGFASRR